MEEIKSRIRMLAKKYNSNDNTEILADTLFYRLTLNRLGEEDNNIWWESSILSEVGRRNLESFFPNTFHKQRYKIANKIVTEKENREITEKDFTTLFNFGYDFETKIFNPFVKDISEQDEWKEILNMIENIKDKKFTAPWVREFYGISKLPTQNLKDDKVMNLGNISKTFYENQEQFENAVINFLSVYDLCTLGKVLTPYYKRRMAI